MVFNLYIGESVRARGQVKVLNGWYRRDEIGGESTYLLYGLIGCAPL